MLKGVEAVAVHGGKDQEEREYAMSSFREGKKDVLVATDVASKGLDFPDIQHVINYDMPKEIENYVHRYLRSFIVHSHGSFFAHQPSSNLSFQSLRRIGRTGRCGKTGIATTFINKNCEETILLDLKHLLLEAKQRVPAVLSSLTGEDVAVEEIGGVKGCAFCGGLGHRIANCPKRAHATQKQAAGTSSREVLTGGDY